MFLKFCLQASGQAIAAGFGSGAWKQLCSTHEQWQWAEGCRNVFCWVRGWFALRRGSTQVDSDSWLARGRLGPMASEPAVPARISKLDSLGFKKQPLGLQSLSFQLRTVAPAPNLPNLRQLHDAARNIAFIAGIAATIVGSQVFTGKWWKVHASESLCCAP